MIDTLESVHGRALRKASSPLDFVIKTWWKATDLPPWDDIRSGRTIGRVEAVVNHGRWIVECPDPDCPTAVLAARSDPRFVCPNCAYGVFEVVWPDELGGIENALEDRPVKDTRNWTPGESVGDLRKENKDHLDHRRPDRGRRDR